MLKTFKNWKLLKENVRGRSKPINNLNLFLNLLDSWGYIDILDSKGLNYKNKDVPKIAKMLKNDIKYKNNFFRGIKYINDPVIYVNPKESYRPNLTDYVAAYVLKIFIDNNKLWANFPKRSYSIIGTNSEAVAYDYAYDYVNTDNSWSNGSIYNFIFPLEKNIAITSDSDMFLSFKKTFSSNITISIFKFISFLLKKEDTNTLFVLNKLESIASEKIQISYKELLELLRDFFNLIISTIGNNNFQNQNFVKNSDKEILINLANNNISLQELFNEFLKVYNNNEYIIKQYKDILDIFLGSLIETRQVEIILENWFNPQKNGFKIMNVYDYLFGKGINYFCEVWTDSEGIGIS